MKHFEEKKYGLLEFFSSRNMDRDENLRGIVTMIIFNEKINFLKLKFLIGSNTFRNRKSCKYNSDYNLY